jgi:hypothetical protein
MANFTEDSRLENWLATRGVKYEYRENIRFDELQPNWFNVNQGRPDSVPKDEALIEKYASAMDQGGVFPSPVLAKTSSGLEVLDGCQRLSAADLCGQTIFNGYIIKSDNPSIRASIRICANSVLNGTAPSQDWTISKIVDVLYEQYGFSAKDCSMWSGQPEKRIEIEIQSRDASRYLRAQGVDMAHKPANNKGFLAAMATMTTMEDRAKLANELPEIVRKLQMVGATNDEATHLLRECLDVNRAKGADLANQVRSKTDEVMKRPEIAARMKGKRSLHPVDNVVRGLTSAITTMRKAVRGDYHADAEQSREILTLLAEGRKLSKRIVPRDVWGKLAEEFADLIGELQTA